MVRWLIMLAVTFLAMGFVVQEEIAAPGCGSILKKSSSTNFWVRSGKEGTGDWVTAFSAWKESGSSPNNISLDMSHTVYECEGKEIVLLQGVINDSPFVGDRLMFHPKCGLNAAISNDGRSAQKINSSYEFGGVLLTNRPLKNNELFEVRLDGKIAKFDKSAGIGITVYSPETIELSEHMYRLKSGNWMMYSRIVYKDGSISLEDYGRNIADLEVGDRIGVLRNNHGTLHYYINGVDQGPAVSNIPYPVYGVFELRGIAVKVTIVGNHVT